MRPNVRIDSSSGVRISRGKGGKQIFLVRFLASSFDVIAYQLLSGFPALEYGLVLGANNAANHLSDLDIL